MDRLTSTRPNVARWIAALACGAALAFPASGARSEQDTPPPATEPPAAQQPAAQKPPVKRAPVRRAPTPATTTALITVTGGTGEPLPATEITVTGPVERHGRTAANGSLNLAGLRAGIYRFRFAREGFITLERDVTIRTPQKEPIEVVLSEADEAEPADTATPAVATASAPPPPPKVPAGEPRTLVVADFVERNFIGTRDPRREDEIGCTAAARTRLLQLREATPEEARDDADETLYVIAGEGTLRLGNRDVRLGSSTVAVVPRGTARAISRKGRNPLVLLSVLSGPPCTQ